LLLCGGDKAGQKRDIEKAKMLARELRAKKQEVKPEAKP
jgi:putative component of toxin-antitoxin plasmid stabilization module